MISKKYTFFFRFSYHPEHVHNVEKDESDAVILLPEWELMISLTTLARIEKQSIFNSYNF
ncbi:hypothetical protein AB672_05905 [Xylella taiwanensis]|nr:hypothetical protein AB672_05905 [Xylella taiwanensis]